MQHMVRNTTYTYKLTQVVLVINTVHLLTYMQMIYECTKCAMHMQDYVLFPFCLISPYILTFTNMSSCSNLILQHCLLFCENNY